MTSSFRLFPLLFAALVGSMAMMAYVAIIGPVVRELGIPEIVAGISMAVGGIFWMLMARPWGRVSDMKGRKPVLLIGLGVFSLAYAALAVFVDVALSNTFSVVLIASVLIIARTLIGAFYAAVPPTAAATIADHTPPAGRQQVMAKLGSANALGIVAGPAIVSLVSAQGLHWGFYATALLPLLGFIAIAFFLPNGIPPQPATEKSTEAPSQQRLNKLPLFDPRLRLAMFTAFVAMMGVSIAQVSVGFFAMDRLGLNADQGARAAGHALTCVGIALMLSQQCVIRLKGISLNQWVVVGAVVSALGFGSVLVIHHAWALLIAYGVGAFGMGFIFPSFQAMAANGVQAHEQGAAAGNVSAAQGLGMVLGPMIGTALYTWAPVAPYAWVAGTLVALAIAVQYHAANNLQK
ncbi:MFS transporter [Lampropedia puyangensis]|uniref:MFS transporter n=1 Tax=Lampropedia puyangensis TaxID=1330072 RepID=A0A4S8ESJ2_9BURK|nr:MFS transporter [Lampropedia puyangensis]THT97839.1 MFS transporter [Lampropedia puyangensis]